MIALPPLYAITSAADTDHVGQVGRLLAGGAGLIQVRAARMADRLLLEQLRAARRKCEAAGARLIVNDRVDLALAAGCHGVHLGQHDLPVDDARRLLGPEAIIGLSTHNREQFTRAQAAPVDYVAIGPVYPTSTKQDAEPALGEEAAGELLGSARRPAIAIGGITLERAVRLWRLGAASVAVIGDLRGAPDPAARVRAYLDAAAGEFETSRT